MTMMFQDFETLDEYMNAVGRKANAAAKILSTATARQKTEAIRAMAQALRNNENNILEANKADMDAAGSRGLSGAMLDRLKLDPARLEGIAASLDAIAAQDDPVGHVDENWSQPNGLKFSKVRIPIGVIGMIYESRPNVTADAAALCLKSGNAVILRGGSEAVNSNRAILEALMNGINDAGLPPESVQLLMTQNRAAVGHMLAGLDQNIDLIIPRGGKGLVGRVQSEARVPVLAHLDGLNHTYVHESADTDMAVEVVANAKMRRTGVCGATETVLIDAACADRVLSPITEKLTDMGCEIRADEKARTINPSLGAAVDEDFATEHLAAICNLAIVEDLDAALTHVSEYSSGHTDAIIASDDKAAQRYLAEVDSAIVVHNASTQFADGGEFGFGAEIGIATGRLHARGPVGAQHLTTFKYQIVGTGTTRP